MRNFLGNFLPVQVVAGKLQVERKLIYPVHNVGEHYAEKMGLKI